MAMYAKYNYQIVYIPQSHPLLLYAMMRSAYLWSTAFLASVSQSHVSLTKDILFGPSIDQ